jgi:hypothetical protein
MRRAACKKTLEPALRLVPGTIGRLREPHIVQANTPACRHAAAKGARGAGRKTRTGFSMSRFTTDRIAQRGASRDAVPATAATRSGGLARNAVIALAAAAIGGCTLVPGTTGSLMREESSVPLPVTEGSDTVPANVKLQPITAQLIIDHHQARESRFRSGNAGGQTATRAGATTTRRSPASTTRTTSSAPATSSTSSSGTTPRSPSRPAPTARPSSPAPWSPKTAPSSSPSPAW